MDILIREFIVYGVAQGFVPQGFVPQGFVPQGFETMTFRIVSQHAIDSVVI